jgi:hypothetical protein
VFRLPAAPSAAANFAICRATGCVAFSSDTSSGVPRPDLTPLVSRPPPPTEDTAVVGGGYPDRFDYLCSARLGDFAGAADGMVPAVARSRFVPERPSWLHSATGNRPALFQREHSRSW